MNLGIDTSLLEIVRRCRAGSGAREQLLQFILANTQVLVPAIGHDADMAWAYDLAL